MVKKVCSFLLSLMLVSTVNAIELSYEGFEGYSEGNLVDLSVLGTGYQADAVWKSFGSDANFQSQGLAYPGLPTTGGSIVTIDSGSALYSNFDLSEEGPFADMVSVIGDNTLIGAGDYEGQVYLSFLVQGDYNNNWGGMTLYNPGELLLFGRTWQHQYFSTTLQDNPAIGDPGTEFDVDKTHMVIVKIDFNAGADDVSVWIDPDLSKNEASQDPAKRVDGQKSDMSFNFAVFRGDGIWHYDELRVGKAWRDVVGDRKSAIIAYPADLQKDVPVSASLEWAPGEEIEPYEYKVYFSSSSDQITESDLVATTSDTIFTPSVELDKDATYYWRVDSIAMVNDEPNTTTGAVWSFDTEITVPVINSVTSPVFGAVGETVLLSVSATDPLGNGMDYSWFIGEVGNTSNPVGTNNSELLIDITDESVFANKYWCKISNTGASVNTGEMIILEKKLIAHWPLENTVDPNNIVPGSPECSYYLNPNDGSAGVFEETGIEGNAARFYQAALVSDVTEAGYFDPMNEFCTVSCWVRIDKLPEWKAIISRHGQGNGWQLRDVWGSRSPGFTTRGTDSSDGNGSARIDDNQWHFVVATFNSNAGTKSVYVDGLKRITDTTGPGRTIDDSTLPVLLAGRAYDGDNNYDYTNDIILDEVKFYNYPMTDGEVADEYVAVRGVLCLSQIAGDVNGDCDVNMVDLSIIASQWLDCSAYPTCISFD